MLYCQIPLKTTESANDLPNSCSSSDDDLGAASSSPEPNPTMVYSPKVGMLSSAVRELSDIMEHMGPSPGCEKCTGGLEGAAKVEFELHSTNESYDKLVILAKQSEARLRSKEEEILELQSKVYIFLFKFSRILALYSVQYLFKILTAFDNRGTIEIRRGREGHDQAGFGGV